MSYVNTQLSDVFVFNLKERASFETVQPAGTEGAGAGKMQKKGLGSFFKVTTDKPECPLQADQAIALEVQTYYQAETIDPEEDDLMWWGNAKTIYPS